MKERSPPAAKDAVRQGPRSVTRTLDVLALLARLPEGQSLTGLANGLRLPKSSLLLLLRSLETAGYITSGEGSYRLGSASLELAEAVRRTVSWTASLGPMLEQMARESQETVLLAGLTGDDRWAQYLETAEGGRALRFSVQRGWNAPAERVMVGQVLLAWLPQARLQTAIAGMQFGSEASFADRRALAGRLEQIRRDGHAVGVGGHYDGIMGMAAPLIEEDGAVRYALAVGGPVERVGRNEAALLEVLHRGAERLSSLLRLAR